MNQYSFYQLGENPHSQESTERYDLPDNVEVGDFDALLDYVAETHGARDWWVPGKPVYFTFWMDDGENGVPLTGDVSYNEEYEDDFDEEEDD